MNKRIRKKHADWRRRAYRSLFSAVEVAAVRALMYNEREILALFNAPPSQARLPLTTDTLLSFAHEYCHDDFQCFCGAS